MGNTEKLDVVILSPSSLFEIERSCIKILHLSHGVTAQRIARWSRFELVGGLVAGMGAYIFYISGNRIGYVFWHFSVDGRLSFPDVEIVSDFADLKLPEGVTWEHATDETNDLDLETQAVA